MNIMTAPGGWKVEIVNNEEFRVTKGGVLMGATGPRFKDKGHFRRVEDVAAVMGDAFAELRETR